MLGTVTAAGHKIGFKREFLDESDRLMLLNYCRGPGAPWIKLADGDAWDDRTIMPRVATPAISRLMLSVRDQIVSAVRNHYGLMQPLYPDMVNLTRWRPGQFQAPHADRENMDGRPHPFPWRDYGCVLYLNDDFEGGEVYFPFQELKPRITPGMLAFFPGDSSHLHGVEPVRSGIRYTLSTFLTHDRSKMQSE